MLRGSLTGPGNPYCSRPEGSTGAAVEALAAKDGVGAWMGGTAVDVVVVAGTAGAVGGGAICWRGEVAE